METVREGMAVDTERLGAGRCARTSLREKLRKLEQEFCSVTRHSGREHAKVCERFELERVVSCGSGDQGWRTKLEIGSCESFDDLHWSTTFWTVPETARVPSAWGVLLGLRFL